VIALAFLFVAVLAWAVTLASSRSMDGMTMGPGGFGPFIASWAVMMAAMMVPSALPLVFEFARDSEGRRGWRRATALLGVTYLGIWVAFGVGCYLLYTAVGMPWINQGLVGGAALVVAGLYALTPLKRASEARCRELCAIHGPLPFDLMRSAVVVGGRYGLCCLGCSAGLMVAMVLIGISNIAWMIVLAALVLAYKVAPAPTPRVVVAWSVALVGLGAVFAAAG